MNSTGYGQEELNESVEVYIKLKSMLDLDIHNTNVLKSESFKSV